MDKTVYTRYFTLPTNPVPVSYIEKRARENRISLNPDKVNLVAVGSLTWKKGFDRLLRAIALLKRKDIHLTILGEGEEERFLKGLASKLNLRDKVTFLGFKTNPYPYMAQADLMVFTSRHEGFPNVLLEANACGTPVLAMKCPGGINEIIIEDLNGWTVKNGDVQTFAKKIEAALHKVWDRNSIRMSVKKRYDVSIIMPQYEAILMALTMRSHREVM